MTATVEEKLKFPIKEIWTNISKVHRIPLRYFNQGNFLPEAQKQDFPFLSDLSIHLAYSYGLGIEIKKEGIDAFEGSSGSVSLAYFGREVVTDFRNFAREHALICHQGRRIHVDFNEDRGNISIEDRKIIEARYRLGEDSFGSSYDEHPKGSYGFLKRAGTNLDGVRDFLNFLLTS